MEWCKLFTLLVAAFSLVKTNVVKKKIRIHLPEKVKHIHHHKKIYITNHESASQYAPAFLPSAEEAVAVPTKVALPTVASMLPFNSGDIYGDAPHGLSSRAPVPAASKLFSLYDARGYYGPHQGDWDDQNFDVIPNLQPAELHVPSLASVPAHSTDVKYPPKRVKIVKINEAVPKIVTHKIKPRPSPSKIRADYTGAEDEYPVSPFHQKFYSDLESIRTIKKIRKPQRVEKFIDGDTEHIHTYSEEHIHKILPSEQSIGTASVSASHALVPIKNTQALFAFASNPYAALASIGSLGTPSYLEYAAYNPHDVTYDHIFHDHGELPTNIDISKNPPKFKESYIRQGLPIGGDTAIKHKKKHYPKYTRSTKPTPIQDFSYYESMYSSDDIEQKPILSSLDDGTNNDANVNKFRPVPAFNFKKEKSKRLKAQPSNYESEKHFDYGVAQKSAGVLSPFSMSNTIIHPSKQYRLASPDGSPRIQNFKNSFANFKDNPTNNFEYDTYAAPSNIYVTNFKNHSQSEQKDQVNGMNFEDEEHLTLERMPDVLMTAPDTDNLPSALDLDNDEHNTMITAATSTPNIIKESSPAHHYYKAMAKKAVSVKSSSSVPTNETSAAGELVTELAEISFMASTETPLASANDATPIVLTKSARPGLSRRRIKKIKQIGNFFSNSDRDVNPLQYHESTINEAKNLKYGDKI